MRDYATTFDPFVALAAAAAVTSSLQLGAAVGLLPQRFLVTEWSVPPVPDGVSDWQREHWSWIGPFRAWLTARRAWSDVHGGALGNPLERLLYERAAREAHYAPLRASRSVKPHEPAGDD